MKLTISKIDKLVPTEKTQIHKVVDGSGLYLVVEKLPINCKRFDGVTKHPRSREGKTCHLSMGVYGKDVRTPKDLDALILKWNQLKTWCKETGNHPDLFLNKQKTEEPKSKTTLEEVFNSFMRLHKKRTKEVTWVTSQNRLNQMLDFFGKDTPIVDLEWDNNGRKRVVDMVRVIENRGSHDHARRCRRLLNNVFTHAIKEQWMRRDQNPASVPVEGEGIDHKYKGNPSLSWNEVPDLMTSINENSCDGTKLTRLAVKFYLMTCIRVSAIVSLEWDWFDELKDQWVLPPQTPGLKRKLKTTTNDYAHIIPATPEIHLLMDELRKMTGYQKYVFLSPEGKKYPHLSRSTINTYLRRLGWFRKLTAHGWRQVVATAGQEEGDFKFDVKEIIRRQIGHTDNKKGTFGAYDNTQFLKERREFLEWWTEELVNQGLII